MTSKTLNDDIISSIIPIRIDADMPVSTLHALETIFYLRLQLAQAAWAEDEPVLESLCRDRFDRLAKALNKKYLTATSLDEKIEILERLASIGLTLGSEHYSFAIEEAEKLKDRPHLTYAQALRLEWIPSINTENESQIVANLLPKATTAFEMGALVQISDFISAEERHAVVNRYFRILDTALSTGNAAELGSLLALAAYWNSDPAIRPRLTAAANKAQTISALTLPERLLNPIASSIYARIDTLTGKYETIA